MVTVLARIIQELQEEIPTLDECTCPDSTCYILVFNSLLICEHFPSVLCWVAMLSSRAKSWSLRLPQITNINILLSFVLLFQGLQIVLVSPLFVSLSSHVKAFSRQASVTYEEKWSQTIWNRSLLSVQRQLLLLNQTFTSNPVHNTSII